MTLDEAIQMAAQHLPDGWQLSLDVERGAAWVTLYDEDGDVIDDEASPDLDLAGKVDHAVSHAITAVRGSSPLAPLI